MRLVDANELEKKLCEDCIGDRVCERRCYEVTMIRGMPTVDAVEHGHWKEYEDECECTLCHSRWNYVDNCTETFKYCPNCGAKMDEVTE